MCNLIAVRNLSATLVLTALLVGLFGAVAGEQKPAPNANPAAVKAKPYPLKTCVVSGDKLGEMGDPYVFVRDGREIKLCCKGCLKDFNKDSAKYIKKIEAAEKQQKQQKK